jgi:fluoroquinolone transport system ATP-binding protein
MSFSVPAGEVFGFLGPNGAGKTTTQRILIGLLTGWEGTVQILGRERRSWGREIFDRIGVSFEVPAGYSKLTGRENLEHFARLHDGTQRDIAEMLDAVGLGDVADRPLSSFSKGMRVRMDLARAMVHNPSILFLDEPTAGLDPVTAQQIHDLIRSVRDRGTTVFLTTHDMAAADALCDRVAFVVAGQIAACGSPRDLKLERDSRHIRVEYRSKGKRVEADFPLDRGSPELQALLDSGAVETVHSTEASLADVFVALTGRAL